MTRRPPTSSRIAPATWLAAIALAAGLTACTQGVASPATESLPTAEAPEPEVIEWTPLPECTDANALAQFEYAVLDTLFDELNEPAREVPLDEWIGATETEGGFSMPLTEAERQALDSADTSQVCSWPVTSHAMAFQVTSNLGDTEQKELIDSLAAADGVVTRDLGEITEYALVQPDPEGEMVYGPLRTAHAFVGDVWVMTVSSSGSDYTVGALESLFAANPELQPATYVPTACQWFSAEGALIRWGDELQPFFEDAEPGEPGSWDVSGAYMPVDTYDACLPLSWITVPINGGTASSPYTIMLFHQGEYVGNATDEPQGFAPRVHRVDDTTLQVYYTWPKDGESNAAASGSSVLTLTWDADRQGVERSEVEEG